MSRAEELFARQLTKLVKVSGKVCLLAAPSKLSVEAITIFLAQGKEIDCEIFFSAEKVSPASARFAESSIK